MLIHIKLSHCHTLNTYFFCYLYAPFIVNHFQNLSGIHVLMYGLIYFVLDVGRGHRWILSCFSQPGQQRWPLICVMAGSIFWSRSLLFIGLQVCATTSKFEGHLLCKRGILVVMQQKQIMLLFKAWVQVVK